MRISTRKNPFLVYLNRKLCASVHISTIRQWLSIHTTCNLIIYFYVAVRLYERLFFESSTWKICSGKFFACCFEWVRSVKMRLQMCGRWCVCFFCVFHFISGVSIHHMFSSWTRRDAQNDRINFNFERVPLLWMPTINLRNWNKFPCFYLLCK